MGYEGAAAMAVGLALLAWGVGPLLWPRRYTTPAVCGRASICRLGGGVLFTLGFLFLCCPQGWGLPVLLTVAGLTVLALLLHRLLWF